MAEAESFFDTALYVQICMFKSACSNGSVTVDRYVYSESSLTGCTKANIYCYRFSLQESDFQR